MLESLKILFCPGLAKYWKYGIYGSCLLCYNEWTAAIHHCMHWAILTKCIMRLVEIAQFIGIILMLLSKLGDEFVARCIFKD